jgi:hypothetical protein
MVTMVTEQIGDEGGRYIIFVQPKDVLFLFLGGALNRGVISSPFFKPTNRILRPDRVGMGPYRTQEVAIQHDRVYARTARNWYRVIGFRTLRKVHREITDETLFGVNQGVLMNLRHLQIYDSELDRAGVLVWDQDEGKKWEWLTLSERPARMFRRLIGVARGPFVLPEDKEKGKFPYFLVPDPPR